MDTWNETACNDLGGLRAAYSRHRTVSDRTAWSQLFACMYLIPFRCMCNDVSSCRCRKELWDFCMLCCM